MGTDIHLYVERRTKDGAWECLPPPERDFKRWPKKKGESEYSGWGPANCMHTSKCYGVYEKGEEAGCERNTCPACLGTGRDLRWYHNRNYDVFAILADVRNGRGFADETGDGFRVIRKPRGVPKNVSAVVRDYHLWEHTPSWLLLSEILAFDWTQETGHAGVIPLLSSQCMNGSFDKDSYEAWLARGGGQPKSWSGGVPGGNSETVPEAAARVLLAQPELRRAGTDYYTQVRWTEVYSESASDFLAFVDTFLRPLAIVHDDCRDVPGLAEHCDVCRRQDNVRVVFGFDS